MIDTAQIFSETLSLYKLNDFAKFVYVVNVVQSYNI